MIRPFDKTRDREASQRIWRECGWMDNDNIENMDRYVDAGRSWVYELHGEPECMVLMADAEIKYLDETLPLCAVTGVTTSHIGRKQGLAGKVVAHALAQEALSGKVVSMLGMFEQGFYNRLGFGVGNYVHRWQFDPSDLNPGVRYRAPIRIDPKDFEEAHASRLQRMSQHGQVNLQNEDLTRYEMVESNDRFGLGYRDSSGTLTHYVWFEAKDMESGPYKAMWMVYQTHHQFLELLAMIKGLGDQIFAVSIIEPPFLQIQDLLTQPIKRLHTTRGTDYSTKSTVLAYNQSRILNLEAALASTHLSCTEFQFNLNLEDPIASYLKPEDEWNGLSGEYVVTLGKVCSCEPGMLGALPTLTASVGAFTRMWLGVRPATSLTITDSISGEPELLSKLDMAFRLPQPNPDWDF